VERDLAEEIRELNRRIGDLEAMIASLVRPLQEARSIADRHLRLLQLLIEHGGLTPEAVVPEVRDPISREIVRVLIDGRGRNVSEVTDAVRGRRGSASRRIVRERLTTLVERKVVVRLEEGSVTGYRLSDGVIRRWSHLLGIDI